MRVRVECYAGYRADQEPRAFIRAEVRLTVVAIERRWREPDGERFVVRADDGGRYTLRHHRDGDFWELVEPVVPSPIG